MLLISDNYKAQNAELHRIRSDFGSYGHRWSMSVDALAQDENCQTILDYGAGKRTLERSLPHRVIVSYDPAFSDQGLAVPADLVVCTDVLEHVEPDCLDNVIGHMYSLTKHKLFFSIALAPSQKTLPDGRNAHLIVESASWWRDQLEKRFEITAWDDFGNEVVGEAIPLLTVNEIKSTAAVSDDLRNEQVRINSERIKSRVTIAGTTPKLPAHNRTAVLVCYGPSLHKTWGQIKIASIMGQEVFTVSAAHRFAIDHGIIPYAHIDCDPREHKGKQIGEPHKDVRYWLASCIHPSYLDKLEGYGVSLWHSFNGQESLQALKYDPEHRMVMGGGSVGLRAVSLLYYLGYRKFQIHGMDCSYENGQAYAGIHLGKEKPHVRVRCRDRWFETSAVFILYARYFGKQVEWLPDCTFELFGDGLLQHMYRK